MLAAARERLALLAKLRQWAGAPEAPEAPGAAETSGAPGAVLVVDDAQWGDPLSLRALSYALRRLPDAPLLTLLAVRDDDDSYTHMPDA